MAQLLYCQGMPPTQGRHELAIGVVIVGDRWHMSMISRELEIWLMIRSIIFWVTAVVRNVERAITSTITDHPIAYMMIMAHSIVHRV